jgi:Na+-transporting methylmalonyl-CoA/oxaloacetate decarboxylase gamma subunit
MENHIFLYLLITVNRYIGAVTHQKDISSVSQPTGEPISGSKVGRQT